MDPIGLRYYLNEIYNRYEILVMVVENGLVAIDELTEDKKVHDQYRVEYLREHIKSMEGALEDGVDLIAYTPWGGIVNQCFYWRNEKTLWFYLCRP